LNALRRLSRDKK